MHECAALAAASPHHERLRRVRDGLANERRDDLAGLRGEVARRAIDVVEDEHGNRDASLAAQQERLVFSHQLAPAVGGLRRGGILVRLAQRGRLHAGLQVRREAARRAHVEEALERKLFAEWMTFELMSRFWRKVNPW